MEGEVLKGVSAGDGRVGLAILCMAKYSSLG